MSSPRGSDSSAACTAPASDVGWRIDYVLATPALAWQVRRVWIDKQADHAQVFVEIA